jgi:hypothetical protein
MNIFKLVTFFYVFLIGIQFTSCQRARTVNRLIDKLELNDISDWIFYKNNHNDGIIIQLKKKIEMRAYTSMNRMSVKDSLGFPDFSNIETIFSDSTDTECYYRIHLQLFPKRMERKLKKGELNLVEYLSYTVKWQDQYFHLSANYEECLEENPLSSIIYKGCTSDETKKNIMERLDYLLCVVIGLDINEYDKLVYW